ncbi:PREDICTED: leucine-rich repeat extensin-like protein 3 [Vollenhovia emeryi]|uniref:leucine-rich repeat extensin-like protein 3 n=1 Tax=Vollenhovia emeryi TaxID=411798 RepID=UPI0005F4E874|nr:PREDICTED: leucine-rich repeat extensin-like protein 3 [Vollenhovia emeryi]
MGRSRRAGRLVQLRRLTRAYATPGVFDPRIFDRPLEPPKPAIQLPPPQPQVPCLTHRLPPPGSHSPNQLIAPPPTKPPLTPGHPHFLPQYRPPDPCPVRAWAPRPPITPAPRPPKASLARAPPAPPAEETRRPPPELEAFRRNQTPRKIRPCVVKIEALPTQVRVIRRPPCLPRVNRDMPPL